MPALPSAFVTLTRTDSHPLDLILYTLIPFPSPTSAFPIPNTLLLKARAVVLRGGILLGRSARLPARFRTRSEIYHT